MNAQTQNGTHLNATLCDAAAEALVANLPTASTVSAQLMSQRPDPTDGGESATLLMMGFVGQTSADVALRISPETLEGAGDLDPQLVSTEDILRPSLEAATAALGTGVMSPTQNQSAEALLKDETTRCYQLLAEGKSIGFFAMRVRSSNAAQRAVSSAQSSPAAQSSAGGAEDVGARLGRLHNVHMGLTVEIGRARVSVRDVLNLEPGAVIELDRNAGAPADVRLNGRLIAQGEVVVMDQEYGVRITKILDSADGAQ